jgi:hypothetical protein
VLHVGAQTWAFENNMTAHALPRSGRRPGSPPYVCVVAARTPLKGR